MCRWPRRVKLQAMTVTADSTVPSDLSTSRKATAISVPQVSSSTTVPNSSQPRPDLYRDPQTLWGTLAETAMHQRRLPLPCHPSARTSAPTCTELAKHARVREGTTAEKESGSIVRGTQESDRAAPLALAETEVRAGRSSSWQRLRENIKRLVRFLSQ